MSRSRFGSYEVKDVLIVPGYGDQTDYIRFLTRNWERKLHLRPVVHAYGTIRPPEENEACYQDLLKVARGLGHSAGIGISFGGSPLARLKREHPDLMGRQVRIASPRSVDGVGRERVARDYPMLEPAIEAAGLSDVPVNELMTVTGRRDELDPYGEMQIPGATNITTVGRFHQVNIVAALALEGKAMAEFIHTGSVSK